MPVNLSNYNLVLPTAALEEWMNRYLAVEEASIWTPSIDDSSLRYITEGRHAVAVGPPKINWPAPPPPRINTLYWPVTGATRWARGYFLCDNATHTKIQAAAGQNSGGDAAISLTVADGTQSASGIGPGSTTYQVYLYHSRPVNPPVPANPNDASAQQLWLIVLTDVRFRWQLRPTSASMSVTSGTGWTTLFSTLATALDIDDLAVDGINGAYLVPDREEFSRPGQNAALLLEAAAWSCGLRTVFAPDGTCTVRLATNESSTLGKNLALTLNVAAGNPAGTADRGCAANVEVLFRYYTQHRPYSNGKLKSYSNSVSAGSTGQPDYVTPSTTQVIQSSCYAQFDTSTTSTPDNDSTLSALATQITTDYQAWQGQNNYDITFHGVPNWTACGFDDSLLVQVGSRDKLGNYQCQTRVQSLPPTVYADQMLQQSGFLVVIGPRQIVSPNGGGTIPGLANGISSAPSVSSCACTVWDVTGSIGSFTAAARSGPVTITVQNTAPGPIVSNGTAYNLYQARWLDDDNVWEFVGVPRAVILVNATNGGTSYSFDSTGTSPSLGWSLGYSYAGGMVTIGSSPYTSFTVNTPGLWLCHAFMSIKASNAYGLAAATSGGNANPATAHVSVAIFSGFSLDAQISNANSNQYASVGGTGQFLTDAPNTVTPTATATFYQTLTSVTQGVTIESLTLTWEYIG